jgi:threonine aldolase
VASGAPAARFGELADTVTVCFSKGLGCPLGAVLASSEERIERAWEGKFLFGGAMRQAGVVAAAALHALEHDVERLAEDHARARRLAEGLAAAGLPVDPGAVETNFIGLEVGPLGLGVDDARAALKAEGILAGVLRPGVLRLATYAGIADADVDAALAAIPRALGRVAVSVS